MNYILLSLSVLPVVVLAFFVYFKDKQDKEPLGMLLKAFLFGALSILPAVGLEMLLGAFAPAHPLWAGVYEGYVVAGFSEELCKLLLLAWAVWKSKHFDEYFDGVVYACFVSLGFACVENIGYVFGQGDYMAALQTGGMRAVLSVPGHFLFGVAMGYYFALARFHSGHRGRHLLMALVAPWALHGTYDALLMVPEYLGLDGGLLGGVLFVVFLWFDIRLWKLGTRRLRRLQALSQQQAQSQLRRLDWGD
ncbi:MAG: PrsW family intramembrane metalloprotease [Bacteroidales bacterium]|nr:PrsW family intramembrane metalloprotease [Bacteroidales bacterium]